MNKTKNAYDQYPLSNERNELNQQLKAERRRIAKCAYQQKRRDEAKREEQRLCEDIPDLQTQCERMKDYKSLISRGLVSRVDRIWAHCLIANIYQDYFSSGIEISHSKRRDIQELFIESNFDANVLFESPSHQTGPAYFIKQAELYATFFKPHMKKPIIGILDEEGNSIQLTTTVDFTIRHNTIATLYPHMLTDGELMQKVVGQQLSFELQQIFHFGENHKVQNFRPIYNMVLGWYQLLQDLPLVAKVLRDQKLHGSFIEEDVF